MFIDIEDSGSEEEQHTNLGTDKINDTSQDSDEPMNSANASPKGSPPSIRKNSMGSDNSQERHVVAPKNKKGKLINHK